MLLAKRQSITLGGINVSRHPRRRPANPFRNNGLQRVEAVGGIDVFKHLASQKSAKDRIVTTEAVIAARPDIVIGSWCGKKFVPAKFAARPGFDAIPAVRDGFLREIKSTLILQPGPAALTDGLDALEAIISEWSSRPAARVA